MSSRPRPILLVVLDDAQMARQIAKMTSEIAELIVARGASRASALLNSDQQINTVLVGRAGDGVSAIDVLGAVRSKRPQARSILLADSSDLSLSIEALHSGVVDHVMNPPLRERELIAILSLPTPRPIVGPPTVTVMPSAKRSA